MSENIHKLSLPLFPLPKLVFFPKTTLPLLVFEPRYIKLIENALQGDKLIGMPQLKPGYEARYLQEPEIYPVFGFGELVWWEKTANNEYNILIKGLGTARLRSEELTPQNYRQAQVDVLPVSQTEAADANWLKRMRDQFLPLLPIYPKLSEELRSNLMQLDDGELFCNIVCMNFIADEQQRQALLEKTNLADRMRFLEQCIASESLTSSHSGVIKN